MVPGTYNYSFETVKLELVPDDQISRVRQFTSNAQVVLDTILRYEPPQIPLMAPLPDRNIDLAFDHPLPTPVLEQLALKGYRCRNLPEDRNTASYVSDKAAE